MKKIAVFLSFVLCIIGLRAQDTVKYQDSWYMFHEQSVIRCVRMSSNQNYGGILVQKYQHNDPTMKVYGIAFTCRNFPWSYADGIDMAPRLLLERQVADGNLPEVALVDSLTEHSPHRSCFFRYNWTDEEENLHFEVSECLEFYFTNPHAMSELSTTFYVGLRWPWYAWYNYFTWITEEGISQDRRYHEIYGSCWEQNCGDGLWWLGYDTNGNIATTLQPLGLQYNTLWGMMFPIVNLRCMAPRLQLVERGHLSATVSWTQAEAGISYELAYGPFGSEPDSGTIVSTTDTSYTLTNLEGGKRTAVWVRKACRYDLYDSTVWSDWSLPVVFMTLDIDEVEEDGVHIYSRDGQIVVETVEPVEVQVSDMLGRRLKGKIKNEKGEILFDVPATGVYMVKVGERSTRKVAVIR